MAPGTVDDFKIAAAPPSCYEIAKSLDGQAKLLYQEQGTLLTYTNRHGEAINRKWSNRAVFLLAGFATENLLKAFLIYENPQYIVNGRLARPLRTHRLSKLRQMSHAIPYKNRYSEILRVFEEGIESWARYPCGLDYKSPTFEREMTRKLWRSYTSMFWHYAKRLEKLLSEGWVDAHGDKFYMRYESFA